MEPIRIIWEKVRGAPGGGGADCRKRVMNIGPVHVRKDWAPGDKSKNIFARSWEKDLGKKKAVERDATRNACMREKVSNLEKRGGEHQKSKRTDVQGADNSR